MTRSRYTLSRDASTGGTAAALRGGASPARVATVGATAVLVVAMLSWPYTVDDAFIVARYARNLVSGQGYAMNPGVPSDGVTGPLWLAPYLLALGLRLDPVASAKLIGAVCASASAWLVLRRLRARAFGSVAAWPACILLALSPGLGSAGVAGLETGAATLLLTLAALAATHKPHTLALRLGCCVAALAWLRPELALACAVLLAYALLRDRRSGALALALAASGALALLAFRIGMFGDWLPLSVRAKPGSLAHGLRYAGTSLVLATSLVGLGLATLGALRGRAEERVYFAVLLAHAIALVLVGGDWMPGYRLLVPVLPLYALLAGWGLARTFARRSLWWAIALGLACLVPAADLVTRIPEIEAAGASQRGAERLATRLRAQARVVALLDAGYLAYASEVEVVDLGGLTDRTIAHMPGGHLDKRITPEYFAQRAPDTIVLHAASAPRVAADGRLLTLTGYPVERRVASLPLVQARYRVTHVERYAPHYYYVVLTNRSGT